MVTDQINRITIALARVEAAIAQQGGSERPSITSAELKARHALLRSETAAALADLDALVSQSQAKGPSDGER